MPSLVFKHISYNRTAQSFRRIVFLLEETIYGIFRIKIVHPTKISSSPNCPLTILLETPYRRMGQSIRINPFAIVFHTACTGIQAIQSGFSPYPKTTLVIFFETAYKSEEGTICLIATHVCYALSLYCQKGKYLRSRYQPRYYEKNLQI